MLFKYSIPLFGKLQLLLPPHRLFYGEKSHILGLCVKIKKINFKANKERAVSAEGE